MSFKPLLFALAAVPALWFSAGAAQASEPQPFTLAAFHAAQDAGKPIFVEADAWWCPICALQRPTLKAIANDPRYANLTIFKIDYDNQKAEEHELGIRMQSTLIAYNGKAETGRSAGVVDGDEIRALALTALH